MKRLIIALGIVIIASTAAAQSPVEMAFSDGLVTVFSKEALASDVLLEWQRIGGTKIEGIELLSKRYVTLELKWVPEAEAVAAIVGPDYKFVLTEYDGLTRAASRLALIAIAVGESEEPVIKEYVAPESRYSYFTPEKAQPGYLVGPTITPEKSTIDVAPEAVFEYYVPLRILEPSSESVGILYTKEPPLLEIVPLAPESRYLYYWPLKARRIP